VEELSDETLMLKVKEGNLSGLAPLFERYHVRVYNFFLKLTFDQMDSQDLTQNVFYRIIQYRRSYNEHAGSFKTWIYRIARNIHFDYSKEKKKAVEMVRPLVDQNYNVASRDFSRDEEDYKKLNMALLQLQPEQRELIVLNRFGGLKYGEISKINGKSTIAVKVQIHRALKQLRTIYFDHQ
jgi:RNA polymerase sigma-70 factor (ECF subfamily)